MEDREMVRKGLYIECPCGKAVYFVRDGRKSKCDDCGGTLWFTNDGGDVRTPHYENNNPESMQRVMATGQLPKFWKGGE
jgi:hypothetical protein